MFPNFLFDEFHYVKFKLNIWVTELMTLTKLNAAVHVAGIKSRRRLLMEAIYAVNCYSHMVSV